MTRERTEYVSTLMVSADFTRVALILKNRPDFLKGRLSTVGGKVESGETPIQAAVREHFEETGVQTEADEWAYYARVEREDSVMHCYYAATDDVEKCKTNENEDNFEEVYVLDVAHVLQAAVVPGRTGKPLSYFLEDERSVADDLVALLGLVWRARTRDGFTVMNG